MWTTIALAIVVAQPIFGWRTIPEFFDFNPIIGLLLGVLNGLIIVAAMRLDGVM